MSTPPRHLRFLPTLTEVVDPTSLNQAPAQAIPSLEDMVQSVMPQVELVLKRRLAEETGVLTARLSGELEIVVRHAVAEAIASRFDQLQSK